MSEKKIIRVSDVMKHDFDVVDGMMTIKEALDAMRHVETKTLLVNKRHDEDEYGILLLSDIAKHVIAKDRSPDRVNVYEVMTKPVISVHSKMEIRYCARLFDQFGLSRAPVIDNSTVMGIISFTDMVLHGLTDS